MTYKKPLTVLGLLSLGLALGCEVPELEGVNATPSAPAQQTAAVEVEEEPAAEEASAPGEPPPVTSEPREVTAKDPKKGKKSRQAGGYLGAVAASRFYAEHQTIFNNINYAMKWYNAEHGEFPKTEEEFKSKILSPNNIHLPELEPGMKYMYDPEDHTLKVYRPETESEAESSGEPSTDGK